MRLPTHFSSRLLLAAALLVSIPHLAGADQGTAPPAGSAGPSKPQMQAAKKFFDRGQELYKEGKFEAAWIEFSSAYEIAPLPDLVFNLARCEVKMNRIKEAIGHYNEFLKMRPDDPESDRIRDEVTRLDRQLRGVPEPIAAPPPPPPAPPARKFPVGSVILGSSTALFLIFGGVGMGVANSRYSDLLNNVCHHRCSDDQVQSVRTPANAGYAMFGLAAVAAVATAIVLPFELGVFRKDKDKDKDQKVALRIGPGSFEVAGRF